MKYYIDFEASEARHEIISVGCIRSDGEEFYSLVYTDDPITERIEELTNISQTDVNGAPKGIEVFTKLFDWCMNDKDMPEFYCYGDSDPEFIMNTFYNATGFKEAAMLSYMYLNVHDFAEDIKEMFYVNKTISLAKLGKYYQDDMKEQNHNALDDAKLLKMVCENVEKNGKESIIFREYIDSRKAINNIHKVLRIAGDRVIEEYGSLEEAEKWIKAQPNDKDAKYVSNAQEKIKKAATEGNKYFKYNWRIL